VPSAAVGTELVLNTNAVEQTRGLGLDLSWNGERQARYGYAVGASAHDSGYALVFELHSSTAERGKPLRGKEDGEEEPVGVGLAHESLEVQLGRDGGLLQSIANLGASKSCARVWLGGGALNYSALGALPLVRALVACRRRAGVGARGDDSTSADASACAPSVGGAGGAGHEAWGAGGRRGGDPAGAHSLVPPSSTSSDDSFLSSQFSSMRTAQMQTYDQQVQPQRLQQQHEGVGGGGVVHAAGGQEAEYAAGRAFRRLVLLSVCSHTHART
jgi:hypothetical protein